MSDKERVFEPKSLEVKFGMVFANWYKKVCTLHVIIDVGKDNWFVTSGIIRTNGKMALCIPGSSDPNYIHLVLGQLTKEQVLQAYDNYFEEPTIKIIVDEINKNSKTPPRIINY